jgi:miniconductance mechanosensitive channel
MSFSNFLFSMQTEPVDPVIVTPRIEYAKWLDDWLTSHLGASADTVDIIKFIILFVSVIAISAIVWWVTRKVLLAIVSKLVKRTKSKWDDYLLEHRFFTKLAHIVPALFVGAATPYTLTDFPTWVPAMINVTEAFILGAIMLAIGAFLSTLQQILLEQKALKDKPIPSYIQLAKIVIYFICGVLIISLLVGKSPLYFFSAMGALTAVLLLIFKDTILGFVASIQLSVNDMVRVGDWVTMEKYGADGDIIEINIATVKVRNFDRTITTIPTYAFIADSFRNWRGMEESAGRRMKRSISIATSSIKWCTPEMIERFGKFRLMSEFIEKKQAEITAHNKKHSVDTSSKLNGRHLTNIGVFRQYVQFYLESNPNVNQEMMCMVRQLPPTEMGLPIELYAFSKDKVWENYESIMADIFDHVLTAVSDFDLEVFQNPTGADFAGMAK